MRVLVIEDSDVLRRTLGRGLTKCGFAVDLVADGAEGLAYAEYGNYDVVVLDLMLPTMDGMTVLKRLRQAGGVSHVLILSARARVEDRIRGLDGGADDYLTKPFEFAELVAMIRALVRRQYAAKSPVIRMGNLALDTCRRTLSRDGCEIPLTPNEYAVLEYLAMRRGRAVSKRDLLEHLYAGFAQKSDNVVEVIVHHLRRKTRFAEDPELIRTRRGYGYLLD